VIACDLFRRHVGAFLDGELDPATSIEFERHVDACPDCQEFFEFEVSYRGQVREALGSVKAPAALADRIRSSLDDAEAGKERGVVVSPWPQRARAVLPVTAAAAAVALIGTGIAMDNLEDERADAMLEDVVRVHSSAVPADVSVTEVKGAEPVEDSAATVARYFRGKVGFPVRPAEFARRDVRLVGARLSNVRERQAAALFYELRGRRLTVVVTDAPVAQDAHVVPVGDERLQYENVRGYTVPMRRHGGLTYAFTGDVESDELLRLAASARVSW